MNDLREAIIRLIDSRIPEGSFTGTVAKVSGEVCSVSPADGGSDYHKVRLKPSVDGKDFGVIIVPKVGSSVIVSPLGKKSSGHYISQWSEVEQILMKTSKGAQILFKDDSTLHLNGDNLGGLVKVNGLLARLNNLEQKYNALVQLYNTHTHGSQPVPAPLAQATTITLISDIENQKVKQGG